MDPIERASVFLLGVLDRMGIHADIAIHETDDNVVLEMKLEEPERIIGRHGKVIDALQHLVAKSVYKDRAEKGKPIYLDAGGYRERHVARLESLATRAIEKVRATNGPVPLPPMSPYNRRIVHMYIANHGLTTQSEGEGEERHIVVLPAA